MPTIQRTKEIFEFIKRYHASNGVAPTIAEIGRQFAIRSSASVHKQLKKMKDLGWITIVPNVSRGIRIVEQEQRDAA